MQFLPSQNLDDDPSHCLSKMFETVHGTKWNNLYEASRFHIWCGDLDSLLFLLNCLLLWLSAHAFHKSALYSEHQLFVTFKELALFLHTFVSVYCLPTHPFNPKKQQQKRDLDNQSFENWKRHTCNYTFLSSPPILCDSSMDGTDPLKWVWKTSVTENMWYLIYRCVYINVPWESCKRCLGWMKCKKILRELEPEWLLCGWT